MRLIYFAVSRLMWTLCYLIRRGDVRWDAHDADYTRRGCITGYHRWHGNRSPTLNIAESWPQCLGLNWLEYRQPMHWFEYQFWSFGFEMHKYFAGLRLHTEIEEFLHIKEFLSAYIFASRCSPAWACGRCIVPHPWRGRGNGQAMLFPIH